MAERRAADVTPPAEGVGRADRRRNDEAIARSAARLLARDPSASVQDIADDAGVSRPTVYRRFPTRDALLDAVRAFTVRNVTEVVDGFTGWSGGTDGFRALLEGLLSVGRASPMALSRHRLSSAPGPVDQRMIALLQDGQLSGVLRSDVPAEYLNAVLLGVLGAACDVTRPETTLPADAVLDMVLRATAATP